VLGFFKVSKLVCVLPVLFGFGALFLTAQTTHFGISMHHFLWREITVLMRGLLHCFCVVRIPVLIANSVFPALLFDGLL
jgi:hypothetical protein